MWSISSCSRHDNVCICFIRVEGSCEWVKGGRNNHTMELLCTFKPIKFDHDWIWQVGTRPFPSIPLAGMSGGAYRWAKCGLVAVFRMLHREVEWLLVLKNSLILSFGNFHLCTMFALSQLLARSCDYLFFDNNGLKWINELLRMLRRERETDSFF